MFHITDDVRIEALKPLISPAILMEELPLSEMASALIAETRAAIERILLGMDPRLLVVVGPCSIHDPAAAADYAARLKACAATLSTELLLVMRVYFEKPRTITGWKGLINDPDIDGSFRINKGLRVARKLLVDCAALGVPAGCEFLDTISPQYIADLVSWGAIGARTTESQVHRELASGLSMPIGFKNGTDGTVQIAIDAIRAAAHSHHFLSVTKQGLSAIVHTRGNDRCHLILRGSTQGSNYDAAAIESVVERLRAVALTPRVLVDCSHGNSGKDPDRQVQVAQSIGQQLRAGSPHIFGCMIESFLTAGRQDARTETALRYGQSITDGCLAWDDTQRLLEGLAADVRARGTT